MPVDEALVAAIAGVASNPALATSKANTLVIGQSFAEDG
jgi:hypothetical protein